MKVFELQELLRNYPNPGHEVCIGVAGWLLPARPTVMMHPNGRTACAVLCPQMPDAQKKKSSHLDSRRLFSVKGVPGRPPEEVSIFWCVDAKSVKTEVKNLYGRCPRELSIVELKP